MLESRPSSVDQKCLNCDSELKPEFSFCPNCGQERSATESVKSFFSNFLSDYFTFDSKIIRSVRPLITQPGFLTLEYLAGKKVRYIPPLRLFIFMSIIFFLILGWFDNSGTFSESTANDTGWGDDFWDNFFESWLPRMFFLLLPLFSLLVAGLYRKKKKSLLPFLLFGLHFHATIFLLGSIYALVSWVLAKWDWLIVNEILFLLVGIYLAVYLWKALRNVFGENRWKTLWKYLVLTVSYTILIVTSALVLLALRVNY